MTAASGTKQPLGAVVFDMDGVLIDTEPAWRRVEIDVLGRLGVELTEADCREVMGVRVGDIVRLWYARHPWSGATLEDVTARIRDGVVDHVLTEGEPLAGALEAVALVRDSGRRCAVASSSPRLLIDAVVQRLHLADKIDIICSAEDEARGKPAPDVYLSAARLLGIDPAGCLAIEDSVNGVLSARAAGMACIAIPDAVVAKDPRFAAATLRLESLRDLDNARLESVSAAYFA